MSYPNAYTSTVSGVKVPANPTDWGRVVKESDYLTALSHQCRFNGHVPEFYSVLQHSLVVSLLAQLAGEPAYVQRAALMHDVHEAYCGDVASPQKAYIEGWQDYEDAIQKNVAFQLNVPAPNSSRMLDETVRRYDLQALALENTHLRYRDDIPLQYDLDDAMLDMFERISAMSQAQARELFSARDTVLYFQQQLDLLR
jgi:5'-deoxynucleotidase YfbR-like HD superfamily hydrolase